MDSSNVAKMKESNPELSKYSYNDRYAAEAESRRSAGHGDDGLL